MSDPEVHRSLGRLEEAVETLKNEFASMREEMHGVVKLANQARGGLRVLAAVGSIGGAIGASIMHLFMKIKGGQ